jgi:hypothetical protein
MPIASVRSVMAANIGERIRRRRINLPMESYT